MLKSQRIATLPIDSYDFAEELSTIDANDAGGEYDAFTFGSWSAHVLANSGGSEEDTSFRPYEGQLGVTELGRKLPGIMSVVTDNFPLERLQWVRIFSLSDGILAPHIDFLEFTDPGTRLQIPLRTDEDSLHSENDIVYHLRRGEVWKIHTTVPHSARSVSPVARLSLCLDFAGADEPVEVKNAVPAEQPVHIVSRPPVSDAEMGELLSSTAGLTTSTMRAAFRRFAAVHFDRQSDATAAFDWFVEAAERTGDNAMADKARAFRTYCIEKRGYREAFEW
ncbi:putative nonproteinogenic amino acid hydroxylase [Streptomyces sp. H27-C3]|uniref:putative nonproteinogenic amino acid hydroxylase n=1 Tax=Streptomyces sp. H27-C3 TaxID=3046305 RepID=UPI0024BB9999|nr:putative nonproteinogenic amino acid hydroxylase [Streptomyces sp. H27-C3]MDJ0466741.1 putative nonproteinogenic amino acid hydroxylase [Streptomyces sp. H27-C3]